MKHYGDITQINGHEVPTVDIITGGSPCQDLSVAGQRAGLAGERSGLFMEQIRIIKEMRDECIKQLRVRGSNEYIRPRYMVWENVPGAFSSNRGEDFRCVLEEVCRIADKTASIPLPRGGKWSTSGCIMGDNWSVAWRVHDAQFWGVPQRRKRIALVADFGGKTAPEILFEREGVSGDIEQSEQERQEAARDIGESVKQSAYTLKIRGGREIDSLGKRAGKGALVQTEKSGTLGVSQDQTLITISSEVICLQANGIDRAETAGCNGKGWREDKSYTLNTVDRHAVCASQEKTLMDAYQHHGYRESEKCGTLTAEQNQSVRGDTPLVCYALDRASFNQGKNAKYDFSIKEDIAQTIVAKGPGGVMYQ